MPFSPTGEYLYPDQEPDLPVCRKCQELLVRDAWTKKFKCHRCGLEVQQKIVELPRQIERGEVRYPMTNNSVAWAEWNGDYGYETGCTATSTSYDKSATYRRWVTEQVGYSTDGTTVNYVWKSWCDSTSSSTYYNQHIDGTWQVWTSDTYETPVTRHEIAETEEQRLASEEELRLRQQRVEEERRRQATKAEELAEKKRKAEEKAKELLLDIIGEEELKIYEETGRLFVHGRKFDYIVQKDGFVKQIHKDKIVDLCVHLRDKLSLPLTDNVIAMKFSIEHEEDRVLELANNHGSHPLPEKLPRSACMVGNC